MLNGCYADSEISMVVRLICERIIVGSKEYAGFVEREVRKLTEFGYGKRK
jgi:hypothetical protein